MNSETRTGDAVLTAPHCAWADEFLRMTMEYEALGESRFANVRELVECDFPAYVGMLSDRAEGLGLPRGHVPFLTYWLVAGARLIGTSRLRLGMTPELEQFYGQIGYDIRPSQRNLGYGKRILALTLVQARRHGMKRVLVTCDAANVASARIIECNGGRLDGEALGPAGNVVLRYWVAAPPT